jgi:hypothetical protein
VEPGPKAAVVSKAEVALVSSYHHVPRGGGEREFVPRVGKRAGSLKVKSRRGRASGTFVSEVPVHPRAVKDEWNILAAVNASQTGTCDYGVDDRRVEDAQVMQTV